RERRCKLSFLTPLKEQPLKTSYFLDTPKRAGKTKPSFSPKIPAAKTLKNLMWQKFRVKPGSRSRVNSENFPGLNRKKF
ncbi:hypothetical protein ACXO7S_09235, partial [Lactobacillus delbrueckii subsp. bulgaricus]